MAITAPGKNAVEPAVTSGWSKREARPGEELTLGAKLSGFPAGTPVRFRIYPTTGDPGAPLANLTAESREGGVATATWVYLHDPARVKVPRLLFEAEVEGLKSLSRVLEIRDSISLTLRDESFKPLGGKKVQLIDALGQAYTGESGRGGGVSFDPVACGDCMLHVPGWKIVGEVRRGDRKFRTGVGHDVALLEMKFTIELTSPKDGEVFLAGDRIPLAAVLKRAGKPWDDRPEFSANNGARIVGKADKGKGTAKADEVLVLPGADAVIDVTAKYQDAVATIKIKAVRPVVHSIKFEGPDHIPLHSHEKRSAAPASAVFGKDGEPVHQHPGAFKLGRPLKARIVVRTAERLSRPARVEVALVTPDLGADGPLALRLPKGLRGDGVEVHGGEDGTVIPLETEKPLPKVIRTYGWSLDVRLNLKGSQGWAFADGNLPIWPKMGELRGLRLNAVFNAGKVGDGGDQNPDADPLKRSEYDPFHVRRCCEWADGASNLQMADPESIPRRLAAALRPHRWPVDYHDLRGKTKAEHPRPDHLVESFKDADEEKVPAPARRNWGWDVVDNPTQPGGGPRQVASLLAAALGTLGVKAALRILRPRPGGAVNLVEHDPVTRGAPCHDPKRDWGAPLLALVGIPVDTSRDEDLGGTAHGGEPWLVSPMTGQVALEKDGARTGHELRPPDYGRMIAEECRCGHPPVAVVPAFFPAEFSMVGYGAHLSLQGASVESEGEVYVEVMVPAGLYGSAASLSPPYGGQVVLTGDGKVVTRQLAGAVQWKVEGGALKTNKFVMPEVPPGKYVMTMNAHFQAIQHHPHFLANPMMGHAMVTVTTKRKGAKLESSQSADHEVGSHNGGKLQVKTSSRLVATVIDGILNGFTAHKFSPLGLESGPVHALNAVLDGTKGARIERGKPHDFGAVEDGEHTLVFSNVYAHGDWRARVRVETNTVADAGKPRPCPVCGAQPRWGYKSAASGEPVDPRAESDAQGNPLKGAFVEALVYPCPNCKRTVHDGDAECWSCRAKLEARKPEDRFGKPPKEATATGGEKPGDGKTDDAKSPPEPDDAQPVGRFDLFRGPLHGVLALQAEGQPSFLNFAYYHPNHGPQKLANLRWEKASRRLSFVARFENQPAVPYSFTVKPDGTFVGAKGGPRTTSDDVPFPVGDFELRTPLEQGTLEVRAGREGGMGGLFLPAPRPNARPDPQDLRDVRWDGLNHTLSFGKGEGDRYFLTFREGGAAFYGTSGLGTRWLSAEGRKK